MAEQRIEFSTYLYIPDDPELLQAMGEVTIRQGQLDHVLKMTIKTTLGVTITEALDATEWTSSSELRKRVRRFVKSKIGDGEPLLRLEALLNRAQRATKRRNELTHRVWATKRDGTHVIKDDNHAFGPVPEANEIRQVADEIAAIAVELNDVRLNGFLSEALEFAQPNNAA
jgi:hypothetical protein